MPSYTRPETITAAILDTVSGLTLGTNLYSGPPKPKLPSNSVPINAVFAYPMFSFQPRPYLGIGKDYREFRITVLVRRLNNEFESGIGLARDCWQALQRADVSAYTGFIYSLNAEADVTYLGLDDTDNHRWLFTNVLAYKG